MIAKWSETVSVNAVQLIPVYALGETDDHHHEKEAYRKESVSDEQLNNTF